jgi:short-subunit dehydrogenase
LRVELEPSGITISLVNSGFVDTPMTQENPFPMPAIISVSEAARSLLAGLEKGKYEIVFPLGFGLAMKVLRLLPNVVFFWFVRTFITKKRD